MVQEASTSHARPGPARVDWRGTARYEVRGCLGRGGMGVVYEAFDRERGQTVAIKTLLNYDPAGLYLFKQEFRTLADVHHTNLVHLYELVVPEDGQAFFSMELVRGGDFIQYLRGTCAPPAGVPRSDILSMRSAWDDGMPTGGDPVSSTVSAAPSRGAPPDPDRLRAALRQLAQGVHALHGAGKLHRDIKPSNVLVTPEGRVVLLDFGVATELSRRAGAAAHGAGEVVGTAHYMAPEQAEDAPPTTASDWYSVGVILYEALVGRPPFVGSAVEVLTLKATVDAERPSSVVDGVPADLDDLCLALLSADATTRPTGSEILGRLGASRTSAPPPVALEPAEAAAAFIGRATELAALQEAFERSRSGHSVTVGVGGASGMGKSTIVSHFLDGLASAGGAAVLRGRAYEREAVPYKAVDAVIDALSRELLLLADEGEAVALPEDAWLLARLFPVLQRVPGLDDAAERGIAEPESVRRRAFAALRELLVTLAQFRPVVVFVDDAQWGDSDSAALLLELLRPPGAPALLLLMTYRDDEAKTSPFLVEMHDRWPGGAEKRDVPVGPLELEQARRLALTLLQGSDEATQRTARAVARESRGSPFLIEELARSNRGVTSTSSATLAVLSLDQMVAQRLERLPEPARRLVEVIAVGGRPLPISVVARASGAGGEAERLVALARTARFARVGLRGGRDVVETTHDRIRETIVAQLSPGALRERHGDLARAFEGAPGVDAEAVATHWLGAGDPARAARLAAEAAEQAAAKYAFEQSARLFRFALEHGDASSPEAVRLRIRFAEVLQLGGRHAESARAYLDAVAGASPDQQIEVRRAAAEQLLNAGRVDEGAAILRGVLAAVGMRAPETPLAAVFWLVVFRIWLAIIGLRFKERTPDEVSRRDRMRVDALYTVCVGFGTIDVILAACMQARHLIEALRFGDRFQLLRAVSLEVSHLGSACKPVSKTELALTALARRLAEANGTEEGHAFADVCTGLGLFYRGRWGEARRLVEMPPARAAYSRAGLANATLYAAHICYFTGQIVENRRRMERLLAAAEDRGDLYTLVNLRTSTEIRSWIADDDPEGGRRAVEAALGQWTQKGFLVQHWQAMVYGVDLDLYAGEPVAAYERFMAKVPAMEKSFLLHSGFVRATTFFVRGRLAAAAAQARPSMRAAHLAEASQMARKLEREPNAWTGMLAALVIASAESVAGNRSAAVAALRRAIAVGEATDTMVYVVPARHRLGEMLGGEEGRALASGAADTIRLWGFRNPTRWLQAVLPGSWGPPE
jgi:hypothetical protein